jgi:uncharacterized protein
LDFFKDNGFVVDDNHDERLVYLKEFEARKNVGLVVSIFLSTACNLACPYCYQSAHEHEGQTMTLETATRFVKWVKREFRLRSPERIHITFFGGEPLLAVEAFAFIIGEVRNISRAHNIPAGFNIVTNGTLLTPRVGEILVANDVEIQVTIDGDQAIHDRRRFTKGSGKGSYQIIFANLQRLVDAGGAHLIQLRMNVDSQNVDAVYKFARTAQTLGITKIYCGQVHFRGRATSYDKHLISPEVFEESVSLEVFDTLRNFGVEVTSPCDLENKYTCLFTQHHAFAISPVLELFKCDELVGRPDFCVGHINEEGEAVIKKEVEELCTSRNPVQFPACYECRFLPICGTGCPVRSLNVHGDIHKFVCDATYSSVKRRVASAYKAAKRDPGKSSSAPSGASAL